MKTVIYKGPTISLGRFGTVEQGAHLQLTEAEFSGVKDDAEFELISRRKPREKVRPLGTPFYDLRLIDWSHARLEENLAKLGKGTLKNVAEAINFVGGEVIVTEHDNDPIIVDAIFAESRFHEWHSIEKEERQALAFVDEPVDPGMSDEDADGAADDGKPAKRRTRRAAPSHDAQSTPQDSDDSEG